MSVAHAVSVNDEQFSTRRCVSDTITQTATDKTQRIAKERAQTLSLLCTSKQDQPIILLSDGKKQPSKFSAHFKSCCL